MGRRSAEIRALLSTTRSTGLEPPRPCSAPPAYRRGLPTAPTPATRPVVYVAPALRVGSGRAAAARADVAVGRAVLAGVAAALLSSRGPLGLRVVALLLLGVEGAVALRIGRLACGFDLAEGCKFTVTSVSRQDRGGTWGLWWCGRRVS